MHSGVHALEGGVWMAAFDHYNQRLEKSAALRDDLDYMQTLQTFAMGTAFGGGLSKGTKIAGSHIGKAFGKADVQELLTKPLSELASAEEKQLVTTYLWRVGNTTEREAYIKKIGFVGEGEFNSLTQAL